MRHASRRFESERPPSSRVTAGRRTPTRDAVQNLGGLLLVVSVVLLVAAGCGPDAGGAEPDDGAPAEALTFDPGSEADREALVEFLLESTMEWDAFASLPHHPAHREHPAGIDVAQEMERYRQELIEADTDEKMWFVLHKISNARRDRHLRVQTVEGGLEVPDTLNLDVRAPIRFAVDCGDLDHRFFFGEDLGEGLADMMEGPTPELGDRVMTINDRTAEEYVEAMRPYQRYSTENGLWLGLAGEITRTRDYLPDADTLPVVLLQWHRFDRDLPDAMDTLMEYAVEHDLLDHHVIVDATRSGGGSRGSYALRCLQPEAHRGTFGNLKVSPAMERWVEDRIDRFHRGQVDPATEDDGTWQLEWLEEDVRKAIAEGRYYTNDVPFKGAHAPRWADGIIEPADVHFTGGLTVWLSPHGGSHLDQFAAQVVDNDVAHLMGMPTGGFSNTWQTTETLRFPTTDRPIVTYQWSLGHSIRPNREILQYNPAEPHEYIPQSRDNHFDYHAHLLERTLERLEK